MLGTLAFISVGKQHHDRRHLSPLCAVGHDELVDDRLSDVHEIAELRLPQHHGITASSAEPILETEYRSFRERAVVDLELCGGIGKFLERRIRLAGLGIMQHSLSMRERPALHILPGNPDRHAVGEKRCKSERLCMAPVDSACIPHRLTTTTQCLRELAVRLEALRPREQLFVERHQLLRARRLDTIRRPSLGALDGLAWRATLTIVCRCTALNALEVRRDLIVQRLDVVGRDDTLGDETLTPHFAWRRVRLDLRIHRRLRESRLVGLVVTVATVTHEIDKEVLAELRAVLNTKLHHAHAGVRILRIHVSNRDLEALGEIARVMRRAPVDWIRREPDLIVRDDVKRPANPIPAQPGHVECLRNNAFTGKRCITVNADWDN